jgi:glycerol dehydrogenase
MLAVFTSPSRYTQGKGATAALGREMAALGLEGPALIIAGKTVIGLLAPTWQRSLEEAGLEHAVHRFGGECSLAEIGRVVAAARELQARTIVGAGGGKVLDTARAAAAGLDLPVVNCPTVASSDAPCSALSVIYSEEGIFQEYRWRYTLCMYDHLASFHD